MLQFRQLRVGEHAPDFTQRSDRHSAYRFNTVAGRYVVLCLYGTARDEAGRLAIEVALSNPQVFDDDFASFFGVSIDADDERTGRVRGRLPGVRHFWDVDLTISRLYGAAPLASSPDQKVPLLRRWVLLNPALQIIANIPFEPDGSDRARLLGLVQTLPPVAQYGGVDMHAPVIQIPHVFDDELCDRLVALYERLGGEESGVMQQRDGKTVGVYDDTFKKRRDCDIADPELRQRIQERVQRRVSPWIRKACCFEVTRMERYIVGCYDAKDGGHFRPHRDNTTPGTAHRRFALSVNLNDDFEGGELEFPEFGPRRYKMPKGGAVVFAGALLHRVTPVLRGRRYAFLPFLYDEAAAREREANNPHLGSGVGTYQLDGMGQPEA